MESVEQLARHFLSQDHNVRDEEAVASACGYNGGFASGCGNGSQRGHGFGDACGHGDSGKEFDNFVGHGGGSAAGSYSVRRSYVGGISKYCGKHIYMIDGISTILDRVRLSGSIAKGRILNEDLTTTPCYIARVGDCFAHGNTLREALRDAQEKALRNMPVDERITSFIAAHADPTAKYPCRDLYDWHNRLTGSCEMGRLQFAREHGIDIDKDTTTVEHFISLTRDAYGGEVIQMLEKRYNEQA